MPKTTADPRRLAYEAGLPVVAVSDGNGGFIRSLVTWRSDWNSSPLGEYGPFSAKDEHRTSHVPAVLWFVAARAQTVAIRTIGSGKGAQECLVFEEVGNAWKEWELEEAARAADRAAA